MKFVIFACIMFLATNLTSHVELRGQSLTCNSEADYFSRNWIAVGNAAGGCTGTGKLGDVCIA